MRDFSKNPLCILRAREHSHLTIGVGLVCRYVVRARGGADLQSRGWAGRVEYLFGGETTFG